jgi:hypothetical protein
MLGEGDERAQAAVAAVELHVHQPVAIGLVGGQP